VIAYPIISYENLQVVLAASCYDCRSEWSCQLTCWKWIFLEERWNNKGDLLPIAGDDEKEAFLSGSWNSFSELTMERSRFAIARWTTGVTTSRTYLKQMISVYSELNQPFRRLRMKVWNGKIIRNISTFDIVTCDFARPNLVRNAESSGTSKWSSRYKVAAYMDMRCRNGGVSGVF
jgi:hypothetical protein